MRFSDQDIRLAILHTLAENKNKYLPLDGVAISLYPQRNQQLSIMRKGPSYNRNFT